jgi:hypothetical protein
VEGTKHKVYKRTLDRRMGQCVNRHLAHDIHCTVPEHREVSKISRANIM